MTAIHLHVRNIHTTVVDIAATEDTAAIVQTVGTITRPCLVVQFLLVVVRASLYVVEVGICCRHSAEVAIADKSIVDCDVGRSEYRATFTTAVSITLDSWNTVDEAGAIQLTNDDVRFTKDITCRGITDSADVITYTTSPSAAIDVTCRTTLDIGIG